MKLFARFASFFNSFLAGETVPDQAAQGRREGSVLRTRPTDDAEMRRVRGGRSAVRRLALLTTLASFACLLAAGPAAAASPWWHLDTHVNPAALPAGGEATLVAQAFNLGDAPTAGDVTLSLTVPSGIEVLESGGVPRISFFAFPFGLGAFNLGESDCSLAAQTATCTLPAISPLAPYEWAEIRVAVADQGAATGAAFQAKVSGGDAPSLSVTQPLPLGTAAPAFGPEHYALVPEEEGGATGTAAGSHPFQLTTTFDLNQSADPARPPALARNLTFRLPAGQLGNATQVPKCSAARFSTFEESANQCPADTVLGVAEITFDDPNTLGLRTYPVPIYNLEPAPGEPARFGFAVFHTPVVLDTSLRSGKGEDYGVDVTVSNTSQLINFISSTVTFWGAPADPLHDESRGWECLARGYAAKGGLGTCTPSKTAHPPAFLTLPTDCAAPFATSVSGISWTSLSNPLASSFGPLDYSLQDPLGNPLALSGCAALPFAPTISAEPTSDAATSPTGLGFEIDFADEGLLNSEPGAAAESQLKKAVVTLPQGFTTNPSVAEGLKACSLAEYEASTLDGSSGCTEESKIGEVEIESPLVEEAVEGSLFVARQGENPNHNLLTLYLVARNANLGVLIKQALKVTPNPVTGQLTTEVDNVPQLPFSRFHLSFRSGQRSPLITPPACGPYTVKALLYPWSNPMAPVERTSSFQITSGPEGQGCPSGGVPPFHPGLLAGSENPVAGAYSPFYTEITRKDSEQEITRFSIKLPPGLSGRLVGVTQCSDAAIAAAKSREHELGGQEELDHPSCPASSEVGHTLVGTGVGNVLAYAPGKLYLAGPYKGSNLSIVSITAAKVGPFDLGTVVIRQALKVDPVTAQVFVDAAGSDPIPHIVDGIPVHLRDIRIYVDRPNFTINPTSCAKMSTAATVLGSGLNFASEADDQPVTVTSPFQAADCASLGFKPQLGLQLKGQTRRGGLPKLIATVTYPKNGAYANIASTIVSLPHSELLEQGHIGTSCTRVQFNEGGGNGEKCPAASIYGHAKAITPLLEEPVEGPVYLRSNGGERQLPDLVAALHSKDINVDLVGFIDSVHKKGSENSSIRTRFLAVPDAPVSKFTLEMSGGKKGLLINSTNLCKGTHRAQSQFVGQNGKLLETEPKVQAQCGKKSGGKKKGGK
jgi:hypothetical protein